MSETTSPAGDFSAEVAPKANLAATVFAVVLAALIGLSAADIHWPDTTEAEQNTSWERDGRQLNGRGKWAGYLNP